MPRSIRILHVLDSLGRGGLENGLVNLVTRLNAGRFEHIVCTIRALGDNAQRIAGRAQVMCLQRTQASSRFQIPALARVIGEVRPDVVHSRNWPAIEAVFAARWARCCPVIHSEHGLDAAWAAGEPWRRTLIRRAAFSLAHRVLTVSGQLRDLHAERTGFPAAKITVLHNGVDVERFSPDAEARARVRAELGLSKNELCIGCVGNLFPVKDHATLLAGVAAMAGEVAGAWRLLVMGEGPERRKLESLAESNPQLRGKVVFLGSTSRVPELLQALDIYALTSITEGICNSLLEAMASGLPVVATAAGGNPEVVVDGECGLLFPVGDPAALSKHLLRLAADPVSRVQIADAAVKQVREKFSIDSMVRNYGQIYESAGQAFARTAHAVAGA